MLEFFGDLLRDGYMTKKLFENAGFINLDKVSNGSSVRNNYHSFTKEGGGCRSLLFQLFHREMMVAHVVFLEQLPKLFSGFKSEKLSYLAAREDIGFVKLDREQFQQPARERGGGAILQVRRNFIRNGQRDFHRHTSFSGYIGATTLGNASPCIVWTFDAPPL